MTLYVQYDPATGFINATVSGESAPACDNQLAIDDSTATNGMMVDTVNKVLIPQPIQSGA